MRKLLLTNLILKNPELKEYTTLMKYPLVFPAGIKIVDTASSKREDASNKKFMMIYKGNITREHSVIKAALYKGR